MQFMSQNFSFILSNESNLVNHALGLSRHAMADTLNISPFVELSRNQNWNVSVLKVGQMLISNIDVADMADNQYLMIFLHNPFGKDENK